MPRSLFVSVIVQTPDVQPASPAAIAKLIVSSDAVAAFAALTASRKEQSPAAQVGLFRSSDRVTVKVCVGIIVVGSVAVLFAALVSPPPDTVAVLLTDEGALAATLTVNVSGG